MTDLETGEQYIGSASNFRQRWEAYYCEIGPKGSPLQRLLAYKGPGSFLWTPLKVFVNYFSDIAPSGKKVSLDFKAARAVRIVSQYECQLLELSIITALKPSINGYPTVVFSFVWDPNVETYTLRDDRPIVAIDKNRCNY